MNGVLIVFAFALFAALHQHQAAQLVARGDSQAAKIAPAQSPSGWRIDWASTRLNYFGRVQPLLQSLSQAVGVSFKETGLARQKEVYVWIDEKGRPLEDVLAEVAKQLNDEADIVIRDREIELRWR